MTISDTSSIVIPPPVIYFSCLAVGFVLDYFWPVPLLPQGIQYIVGVTLIAISFLLFAWVLMEFSRSKTSIDHRKPTTEIISTGPFRFSRNPVYLSMSMLLVGIAVSLDSIWVLAMSIPAVLATHYLVILREEAYLKRKFGAEYQQYMDQVRRWI